MIIKKCTIESLNFHAVQIIHHSLEMVIRKMEQKKNKNKKRKNCLSDNDFSAKMTDPF